MPPTDTEALHAAAQRHAYAQLVRTDGWRLYMTRLLTTLWNIDRGQGSPDFSEHHRSKIMGRKEQILMDITDVYREAGEESPLEAERKAILERLAGMPYKAMPEETRQEQEEDAMPPRRARRTYAGGVE